MDVSENTEQQTSQTTEVSNMLTKQLQTRVLYCWKISLNVNRKCICEVKRDSFAVLRVCKVWIEHKVNFSLSY